MSYRLDLQESAPDSLRRVAIELLSDAADQLERARGGVATETAIHTARKDLKRGRSLLRLARPGLPKAGFRVENRRLRDIGRSLSASRDSAVLGQTMSAVGERSVGRVPERVLAELGNRLDHDGSRKRPRRTSRPRQSTVDDLRAAAEGVQEWPLERCNSKTLVRGAARSYEQGRRAFKRAERDPSDEKLHEWRKRAKDAWYHARLLCDLHPEVLRGEAKAAHALSDLLGTDHDLATLRHRLLADDEGHGTPLAADLDPVIETVDAWRRELQADAFALGRRVYAVRAKDYARRLEALMRVAPAATASA